ncbi:hypothetical protein [Pseudanabaena sp. 'Roaring Creek']|uniref:hypothetical protein n=1 Tax=Pseudanabaena sp. 'Roaring Creek' TaxID=1681830 RepID=UPI000A8771EB|nr:hypothetical protein [Pseudanabaena sp. 'Roaring Creek']
MSVPEPILVVYSEPPKAIANRHPPITSRLADIYGLMQSDLDGCELIGLCHC